MLDDGLHRDQLDAWNNPDKYTEKFTFTKEELHAPLYIVIRKNIKTKLETHEYKKYRIIKEEKHNKTKYKIEELDLIHQPCWYRDMFGFNQLWQLQWTSYWFGYGSPSKEQFLSYEAAKLYVDTLLKRLVVTKEAKSVPSKIIVSVHQ